MNCKKCRNCGQEKFLDGAHSFCKVRYISSNVRFPVIRETDFSLSPSNRPSISRQTALMMRQTLVQSSQTVKLQKPIILLIISDTRKSLTPNLKCCKCFCLLPPHLSIIIIACNCCLVPFYGLLILVSLSG